MTPFVQKLKKETDKYLKLWGQISKQYGLSDFAATAIGWKTENIDEFNTILSQLLKSKEVIQAHVGLVDNRYIASIVFKKPLTRNIRILKLMQRRIGSKDPVGLDHLDFYITQFSEIEEEFKKKKITGWEYESNEAHKWISLKAKGIEAKFVDHIVLDVAVKELTEASQELKI